MRESCPFVKESETMPFKLTSDPKAQEKLELLTGALDSFKSQNEPPEFASQLDNKIEGVVEALELLKTLNPEALKLQETCSRLGVEEDCPAEE
jgi:hypothetical protein